MNTQTVNYRTTKVHDLNVFYRESGPKNAPTILLLHGYPTSSHMYRQLIPILNNNYHVIAPDLIGFGFSDAPHHKTFKYTFDNLTKYVQGLVDQLGLKKFAIQVFDYGAPVGFRLAMANPEKITGIISQNGNAYVEGLSEGWNPIQKYWSDPTEENRNNLRAFTTPDATKWQYTHGVADPSFVAPESYTPGPVLPRPRRQRRTAARPVRRLRQQRSPLSQIPRLLQKNQPPFLAVWGNKDPFFIPPEQKHLKRPAQSHRQIL
ncbi:alpha/beta hydrolase [Puia sp. P3]|uniref:alpha/beta hydrolase n=1 Tax=Puia sp. P3 TaxID=3423952 RepID=UPI003D67AC1D